MKKTSITKNPVATMGFAMGYAFFVVPSGIELKLITNCLR